MQALYTDRSNAARAAKAACKKVGIENPKLGVDFQVHLREPAKGKPAGWVFTVTAKAPEPKKKFPKFKPAPLIGGPSTMFQHEDEDEIRVGDTVGAVGRKDSRGEVTSIKAGTATVRRPSGSEYQAKVGKLSLIERGEDKGETEKLAKQNDPEIGPEMVEKLNEALNEHLEALKEQEPAGAVEPAKPVEPVKPEPVELEEDDGWEREPAKKPVLKPEEYGLTPEVIETVLALAAKAQPVKAAAKERSTMTAAAQAAAKAGQVPDRLVFKTATNPGYQKHADALFVLAVALNREGLAGYSIKGVNTYARALHRWRLAAIEAVEAIEAALAAKAGA